MNKTIEAIEKIARDRLDWQRKYFALKEHDEKLQAALKQVIAVLTQPVQTSGNELPSTCQVLRGDCQTAVKMAQAALRGKDYKPTDSGLFDLSFGQE